MSPLSSRYCVEHRPGWNAGAAESDAECRPDYPLCRAEKGEQGSPRQRGLQGRFSVECVFPQLLFSVIPPAFTFHLSGCLSVPVVSFSFPLLTFQQLVLTNLDFVLLFLLFLSLAHTDFLGCLVGPCGWVWLLEASAGSGEKTLRSALEETHYVLRRL